MNDEFGKAIFSRTNRRIGVEDRVTNRIIHATFTIQKVVGRHKLPNFPRLRGKWPSYASLRCEGDRLHFSRETGGEEKP
jgi:hypothetical protein